MTNLVSQLAIILFFCFVIIAYIAYERTERIVRPWVFGIALGLFIIGSALPIYDTTSLESAIFFSGIWLLLAACKLSQPILRRYIPSQRNDKS
jgi:hypothetical protein